jgi:hypothetical protein
MPTLNRKHWMGVLTLASAVTGFSGCMEGEGVSDEDAELLLESESTIVEGVVSSGVDLVAGVLNSFPEWSSGQFLTAPERESVSWNAAEQAWIISSIEEYGDEHVNGVADFTVWIQFRVDGMPVHEPDNSVQEMEVRLDGTNLGRYENERYTTTYDWTVNFRLIANGTGETKKFTGAGQLQGYAETESGDRSFTRPQDFTWDFDLSSPGASSCATGTLNGVMGLMTMTADFLEEGQVSWSLSTDGAVVRSGEAEYGCGQFESVW